MPRKHSLLSATETRSVAFGSAPFHSQTAPECFTGSAREPFVPATKRMLQLGATHVLRDNSKLSEFLDALGAKVMK